MPADPWIAFDAATDPKRYARVLRRAHAAVLADDVSVHSTRSPSACGRATRGVAAAERLRREYAV